MNLFLLLIDPDGGPIPEEIRYRYEGARCCAGLDLQWEAAGGAAALLARDAIGLEGFGPRTARWESYLAVGNVRLDNRPDVARWAGCQDRGAGLRDLDLIMRAVATRGEGCIADILGDFAFAIWDSATRRVVAARDAFGVKRLCYRDGSHLLAFSSRAELLADGDAYDIQPLVEMIALCHPSPDRTVYAGVRAVPPASVIRGRGGALAVQQYWSPEQFEPRAVPPGKEQECYDTFRALFAESVRQRLTGAPNVWSQLSGGLDSSSVVSMAQWLARRGDVPHGVVGTISWLYRWSTDGDEREYSGAVARHWGVRNEVIGEFWPWADDDAGPPITDEPSAEHLYYVRERQTARIIAESGGRVLLTGLGSDHYLIGNMFFFADWVAGGHLGRAACEMLRRAAIGRVSFWNLAYQNVVLPLLPPYVQRRLVPGGKIPAWLLRSAVLRCGIHETGIAQGYGGPARHKYVTLVRDQMKSIPFNLRRDDVLADRIDVRHPFLDRRLVEFGLRLPAPMCVQPHARKWVLRQAMCGVLPDLVRSRVGKGANFGTNHQALVHERVRIREMLRDPILAQIGCIDATLLARFYKEACDSGRNDEVGAVIPTLAVETWLGVRSGRWSARPLRGRKGSMGDLPKHDSHIVYA